jgi:hypothetical protein
MMVLEDTNEGLIGGMGGLCGAGPGARIPLLRARRVEIE